MCPQHTGMGILCVLWTGKCIHEFHLNWRCHIFLHSVCMPGLDIHLEHLQIVSVAFMSVKWSLAAISVLF